MTLFRSLIALSAVLMIFAPLDSRMAFSAGTTITAIDFHGTSSPNQIEVQANGPIDAQKQVNTQDHQIVLTIAGATLSRGIGRAIDTSSFNSPVTMISPYQVKGDNPGVRIVVQLREDVSADMVQNGNSLKLTMGGPASAASNDNTAQSAAAAQPEGAQAQPDMSANSDVSTSVAAEGVEKAPKEKSVDVDETTSQPQASEPNDQMQKFLKDSQSQHFSGKPITLQVRDADVSDIFSLISDASGFNIVLGDDVRGKLTVSLIEVPWDQALDVVLKTLQLGADRNGNVLRIMTLKKLADEKELELKAKKATEAITPRITRVFPINYADLTPLKANIVALLGEGKGGAGEVSAAAPSLLTVLGVNPAASGGAAAAPGAASASQNSASVSDKLTVVADERTNSLIVQTLPANMERVRKLIEILDTQTPQVLIEGKVIEATESFVNTIGGSLGIADIANGAYSVAFSGANAIDPLLGAGTSVITDTNVVTASQNGASFGWSLVKSSPRINILLNIGETENKTKVVSSPKVVVLNKQDATIVQSTPVIVPSTGIGPNGGIVTTSTVQQANLSLDVTPTVTSDGSVLMKLMLERDVPFGASGATQANAVANRNIKTNVLVDSGDTLVMGGFFTTTNVDGSTGFPVLKDIPIIGWLFGSDSHELDRSELFFFVTPQVLNPKKVGNAG